MNFVNLNEMDKFLKNHPLPKLTQDKIDNLNSPIIIKEVEFVDKKQSFQK